jgi:peptidoglycan/LPS O-acetylase OafA/YrhL
LPYWFTWIAGAALAEQHKKGELKQPPFWISILGILFFLLGLYCAWRIREDVTVAAGGGHADLVTLTAAFAFGVAFSVLLWWSIMNQRIYNMLPPSIHGFLLYLGAISYSLYLFHTPFFRLCGWLWTSFVGEKPTNYLTTFPFVVLALGIAWIAYKGIEAPAHLAGRKLAYAIKCRHALRARKSALAIGSTGRS